jgi:hypothetical protein
MWSVNLRDFFGFGFYQVPEAFGPDDLHHAAVLQDLHFDLGEIREREGQLHGAVFKKYYFLILVPNLVSDPPRFEGRENNPSGRLRKR